MARYALEVTPRARRDLERLSPDVAVRIEERLCELRENPRPRGDTVKRLRGFEIPTYRLRVGDYRVIFRVAAFRLVAVRIVHRSKLDRELHDLE